MAPDVGHRQPPRPEGDPLPVPQPGRPVPGDPGGARPHPGHAGRAAPGLSPAASRGLSPASGLNPAPGLSPAASRGRAGPLGDPCPGDPLLGDPPSRRTDRPASPAVDTGRGHDVGRGRPGHLRPADPVRRPDPGGRGAGAPAPGQSRQPTTGQHATRHHPVPERPRLTRGGRRPRLRRPGSPAPSRAPGHPAPRAVGPRGLTHTSGRLPARPASGQHAGAGRPHRQRAGAPGGTRPAPPDTHARPRGLPAPGRGSGGLLARGGHRPGQAGRGGAH